MAAPATSGDAAPVVAAPDPQPRAPGFTVPPGACDCHAHVCGPATRYPLFARRIYSPPEATGAAEYAGLRARLGIERAVLVQPSFYGTDNRALLDAMAAGNGRMRGVAVLGDADDARTLERLHEAGVRGARVNIVDLADGKGQLPVDRLRALAGRIRPFGWHLELLMHVDEFPGLDRLLADLPVPLVFGHLGYVRKGRGVDEPGFQAFLRLLRDGRAWAKLTGPYRISSQGLPHPDIEAFAQALRETAPRRLLWGSDWPHVMLQWNIPMPNDGDLLDLLARWVPDAGQRRQVLVDNPAALYGFPT
ncbi:amidohydrolase family protein [Ramlibacter sp. AW1]|uniref:Amidohydrolase family protein n=1 Tax=Ramlibacter aurantiacus TaxID=2801330 RepID=A0A937D7E6_9BURK|nr:amidohydrolase family protein [Ramlibacter aurantiacus]MBL0421943.1 amidohydrolase family protein [Ramlibacter aurantiacus]